MKRIILGLVIVLALPALLLAQAKAATPPAAAANQKLSLEFVDGNTLSVTLADKSVLKFNTGIFEGDPIPAGSTIVTGADTSAELKLVPNGSIIKLSKNTTFSVKALQNQAQPADKNAFQIAQGKVKAIAAKSNDKSYQFQTPTAVCGVRGTDFVLQVEDGKELLAVKNGLVDFQKADADGNPIGEALSVAAGMAADALAATFSTFSFPASQYDSEFSDMTFKKLVESEVQQAEVAPTTSPVTGETGVPGTTETTPTTAAGAAGTVAEGAGKLSKNEVQSGIFKWLADIMGLELGSVTINNTTYSKAIVQPNINLGKLKFGLYLPIIYSSNMFDPKDWYHPGGNDEWSFGTQKDANGKMLWQSKPVDAAIDAASDLALKVKFLEFGKQLDDPFFIKVGNLNSLTIGHGLIMRNYNNSTEFPAIRRIGFNLGIDAGGFGFEALVNDLANPGIFGGRIYFRPISGSKIALGLSGAADLSPASDLYVKNADGTVSKTAAEAATGDPMFLSSGLDLDLPIIQGGGFLTVRAFADAAATVPYTRTKLGTKAAGLQYQLIYDSAAAKPSFQNWGAAGGLMGNVLFIDYRLEYRYYTGFFKPAFYDTTYDKNRAGYAIQYANYITNPSSISTNPSVMGIYGEGGFSFIKDRLSFRFGYAWPFDPSVGGDLAKQLARSSDELHASLIVKKGLIPIIDIAGSITYDRRGIAQALANNATTSFRLIDEKTTFAGELVVPVPKTPNLDVAVVFSTVPVRNSDGSISYSNAAAGIPNLTPSVTFETRFHF